MRQYFHYQKIHIFAIACGFNRLCTCIRNIPNSLEKFFTSTRTMGKVEILGRRRVFFEVKKGGKYFFSEKKGGLRVFSERKKGSEDFFIGSKIPKTRSGYLINFVRSLRDPSNISTKHCIRLRLALGHLKSYMTNSDICIVI